MTPQAGHAARAARVATVPAQAGPPPEEARPVAPEPTTEPEPEPVAEPTAAPVNGILATAGALIPILTWLPRYRRAGLRNDILAGLVVAALAIPQSMGYAVVAGVGVEVGLYTLPPALLAYVVFGSSRLLVVGPVSTVSLLSGSLVGQLSGGDPARAASLTAALALGASPGSSAGSASWSSSVRDRSWSASRGPAAGSWSRRSSSPRRSAMNIRGPYW
ncbi:MAG: SulP family inorganic anion transporter [Kineosporiaceae bacterium]